MAKRRMYFIAMRVNGITMERILKIAKELFPRHKYMAYQVGKLYPEEEKKYSIQYNLTDEEYLKLVDTYNERRF